MNRIPFAFDLSDGLVTIRGTARLEDENLVVTTRHTLLDMVPYRHETFRLALDEIASIEVERGMVRHRLRIEPFSADHLDGFPGDPDGELVLPIKRKHAEAAEALARSARLRNLPL